MFLFYHIFLFPSGPLRGGARARSACSQSASARHCSSSSTGAQRNPQGDSTTGYLGDVM